MPSFGVNYGNRFIPEDWMEQTYTFFKDVEPSQREPGQQSRRVSLADVPAHMFQERMTQWLDEHVKQSDFVQMRTQGVDFVRVPTGYWNWVSLPESITPNGPERSRMLNLQMMSPEEYKPYLERIFAFAAEQDIQVLLDLHALPGSQNGQMHSGLTQPTIAFDTDWNLNIALDAVKAMSRFGSTQANLFGIQVINEPDESLDAPLLDKYYSAAILAAREFLPKEIPVILFTWTFRMDDWRDNHFGDYARFGCVVWDTHIYHVQEQTDFDAVAHAYWKDLERLESFHCRQIGDAGCGGAMVLEWSLAGPRFDDAATFVELARWLAYCFAERSLGSAFWNLDAPYASWSLLGSASEYGVNWAEIPR